MADRIKRDFPTVALEMIEGRAGIFLVKVDGETIWDKHEQNDEFPEEGFICESIAACGK